MMHTDEQLDKAAEILYRTVTDQQVKLAFGARKRTQIKEALERGEAPRNYRTEWIREARGQVVDCLQKAAADFNKRFPHDACSVMDLLDVLATTHYQFQRAIKEKEAESDAD